MKKIIYRILFVLISILFLIIISFYSLINLSKPSNNGTVNISNVFDKYDPPYKSYSERLDTIKKAKELQAQLLEQA